MALAMLLGAGLSGRSSTALEPVAVLAPSDVPPGWTNDFGWSVAISGRYVAVGAPRDPWFNGDATGAVYVFRRQGARWIEQAKLTASDPQWPAQLGWSVAMEGDVIVAGAPSLEFKDCGALAPGAACVFRRNDRGTPDDLTDDTWDEEAKLVPPPIFAVNAFGESVAISGDMVVMGSPCGGAAVFRKTGDAWGHEITFVGGSAFGHSVSASAERVVVGAYLNPAGPGSAQVFRRGSERWFQEDVLTPSDYAIRDSFGFSVSISGETILVGAPDYDAVPPETTAGLGFVYQNDQTNHWIRQAVVTSSNKPDLNESGYGFGSVVAVDGDMALFCKRGHPWGCVLDLNEIGGNMICTNKLHGVPFPYFLSASIHGNFAVISTHIYAVRQRTNLLDFAGLQNCFSGGAPQENVSCAPLDYTLDGKVNIADFAELSALFVGP